MNKKRFLFPVISNHSFVVIVTTNEEDVLFHPFLFRLRIVIIIVPKARDNIYEGDVSAVSDIQPGVSIFDID